MDKMGIVHNKVGYYLIFWDEHYIFLYALNALFTSHNTEQQQQKKLI